ncbi:hypothetical protein CHUAL_000727 [Chamberlinius hualienensis]
MVFNALLQLESLFFIIVTILIGFVIYWYVTIPHNLPPGPKGLPIVGYLPFVTGPPFICFSNLAKKYGKIFHVYLGGRLVVVLDDFSAIKEAYIKQRETFAGRPLDSNFFKRDKDRNGILSAEGELWRQHRRFVVSNLRDNGVGKLTLEPLLHDEIQKFLCVVDEHSGKPTSMTYILGYSVLNNVLLLVTGNRLDYDNELLTKMLKTLYKMTDNGNPVSRSTFMPWLSSVLKIKFASQSDIRWQCVLDIIEITKTILATSRDGKDQLQYENLVDSYTDNMKNRLSDRFSLFSKEGLFHTCRDLIIAGTETSAKTLTWALIHMTNHQEIQRKVQNEIDNAIGRDRLPSYADRSRTPYIMATIAEIHRATSLVRMSLPHKTTKNTTVLGYYIPKNTIVFANLWSVHNDKKLWGDPENFRPERFLNSEGQCVVPEYLIPFSAGKRSCAGEPLAKMELYLYFTAILQRFNVVTLNGKKLPLDSVECISSSPLYDFICFEKREN